ncbi:MAG: hypothetical protein K8F54_13090 [Altibacter sp.]|uniref:hypothetical protein n=1 Tax=Altibacter sp. TaxID=2024823 RepID=UPI001D315583|nr:hypothetical protein [Altibacter sp.]MBZ0328538.1 hypothetical protein [Altibacter sp.]
MQTRYPYLKKLIPLVFMGLFVLLLSSCGTHNTGYSETDGIYTSETDTESTIAEETNDKSNYYKQYFNSKTKVYEDLPDEDLIFTDIEAYSTTESLDEEGYIVIEEEAYDDGYGPWGDNSEDITINVYNYGGYYGGYAGHYYNPYWYGYWVRPYWSIGYTWGWGYPYYGYYGWGYPSYYYGGYYGHYYNPYYGYGGYGSNIAYNRGRRNLDYSRGRTTDRGKSNVSDGRSSYSRSELTRRNNSNTVRRNSTFTRDRSTNIRRNSTLNNTRSNSNNSIRNTRTTRPNTNTIRNNSSNRNNNSVRRSNNVSRPNSSSNNSGSSVRSSGGSSRSSGTSRSGGGRRGGGGLE